MSMCPRSVAEFSAPGKSFVPACKYPRSVTESSLGDGKSEVSNRVLFGGWDFFFSTTTYGGAYVVVVMSHCPFLFVCPRNYLNNIQDIIKVHFCQLKLVVSFNNILYT